MVVTWLQMFIPECTREASVTERYDNLYTAAEGLLGYEDPSLVPPSWVLMASDYDSEEVRRRQCHPRDVSFNAEHFYIDSMETTQQERARQANVLRGKLLESQIDVMELNRMVVSCIRCKEVSMTIPASSNEDIIAASPCERWTSLPSCFCRCTSKVCPQPESTPASPPTRQDTFIGYPRLQSLTSGQSAGSRTRSCFERFE